MDVFSHGLWSAAIYKIISLRIHKPLKFWLAALFGMAPDLLSFGLVYFVTFVSHGFTQPYFMDEHGPNPELVPTYVEGFYNYTHSLPIFLIVFLIVWAVMKKPVWEMGAWGLHILADIPTHTTEFFPTPFLWPISSFKFSGISWGHTTFLFVNYLLLFLVFILIYFLEKKYLVRKNHKG